MELLKNKSITQKIIIATVLVILINFTLAPNFSHAKLSENIGNMLLDVLVGVGDGILMLANGTLYNQWKAVIHLDIGTSGWKIAAGIGVGVLAAAGIIATAIVLPELIPALAPAVASATGKIVAVSVVVGGVSGTYVASVIEKKFPDDFYLPISVISPDKIFANKVGAIDVNFFNPKKTVEATDADGKKFYYVDVDESGDYSPDGRRL